MLGEGDYTVVAYDRGGVTPIGEVTQISSLHLERVKDETGECTLVITGPDDKCCEMLGSLRAVRHEIVVHRNGHRVWEGPITRLNYSPGEVQIDARDITWYMSRRAMSVGFDHTGVSYPALQALYETFTAVYPVAGDPFNIGQHIACVLGSDDANTAAVYKEYTRTLFNLLEQYAARGGVDYTVTGRRLIMTDAHTRAHVLPKMTDEHLSGSVNLTEYGQELKTRTFISNSEGSRSESVAPPEWLDYYGPIDFVENNTDEADGDDRGEQTEEEKEAIDEIAHRILLTGYPTPVRLWIPDDSRLDPCYPAEFSQLQAGAWVPVQTTAICRPFSQWQKLQRMQVQWTPGSEAVNITLIKAPDVFVEPTGSLP